MFAGFLAVGVVILISIAISAGVVFLLVLLGILWTLLARRGNEKLDYAAYEEDDESIHQHPTSLLEHINEATRGTIIGVPAGFDNSQKQEEPATGFTSADPFAQEHDGDHFQRAETPSDAVGAGMATEEQLRPGHARYSFDAPGEGELPLAEGMSLDILDDRDPEYVKFAVRLFEVLMASFSSFPAGGMLATPTPAEKGSSLQHM